MATVDIDLGSYKLGWHDSEEDYVFKPQKGLNEEIIREMSRIKDEPAWMLDFRLKAYKRFLKKPLPTEIDFDDIYYYVKPTEGQAKDWDMVPDSIKETYEKLGIPEAERKYLAGVTAQYESEVVYHRNREDLEELSPPSTRARSSITATVRTSRNSACCSATWTPPSGSIPRSSRSTSGRSSPRTTTSSPHSTQRSGPAGRSSTCPPGWSWTSRSRPTSGSTPRTWASSSGL
jgi:hypothetical protein